MSSYYALGPVELQWEMGESDYPSACSSLPGGYSGQSSNFSSQRVTPASGNISQKAARVIGWLVTESRWSPDTAAVASWHGEARSCGPGALGGGGGLCEADYRPQVPLGQ